MSTEIVDTELLELIRVKNKLVEKATALRNKLVKQETEGYEPDLNMLLARNKQDINNTQSKNTEKIEKLLCDTSSLISGITYENLDKKWLRDDTYLYLANVKTKVLLFILELTIDLRDEPNFEIIDITCHFLGISKCYILEISVWVQRFTGMKNLSYLMSAISEYTEKHVMRANILQRCQRKTFLTVRQCTEEDGGISIYVQSLTDPKRVYLNVRWTLKFTDRTWHLEHYFVIETTKAGYEFVSVNNSLLQSFCQSSLTKKDLELLWSKLYVAIETFERRGTEMSD